jgi:hypothetical protein
MGKNSKYTGNLVLMHLRPVITGHFYYVQNLDAAEFSVKKCVISARIEIEKLKGYNRIGRGGKPLRI